MSALSPNWSDIVSKVRIHINEASKFDALKTMRLTSDVWNSEHLLGPCTVLDYKTFNFSNYTPKYLIFLVPKTEEIGIELKIEEQNKALRKRLSYKNIYSYTGPRIENPNLNCLSDTSKLYKND